MPTWDDIPPFVDRPPRGRLVTASNALVLANLAGLVATGLLGTNLERLSFLEFDAHRAIDRFELWQFVTYSFVQVMKPWFLLAFSFVPAAYGLYTLGNALEEQIGYRRILVYYFSFAFYGALAHALYQYFVPESGHDLRSSGLLGPAYGIALAEALRAPSRPVLFFFVMPMRAIAVVTLLGVLAILFGIFYFQASVGPLVGASAAALGVAVLEPRIDAYLQNLDLRRERERFVEEVEVRREVDRILEKITHEGMRSLTREERRILRRGSELLNQERGRQGE
jgi:membrane associated rhomboid family serine protease